MMQFLTYFIIAIILPYIFCHTFCIAEGIKGFLVINTQAVLIINHKVPLNK